MKDLNIDSNTTIFPKGQEIFFEGNKNHAILMIHGFTGIPHEMRYLAEKLYESTNYTIYIPRLPGHGTNNQDFRESTANNWLRKTYDSYLKLKSIYKDIYVIGLSMGGLLALLTTTRFKVKKLITISPALYSHNFLIPFTPLLKYFMPKIKQKTGEERIENAENKEDKFYHENYHRYHYTAQVAELAKIMKLTKKRLTKITSPTLILASTEDELVPIKAAKKVKDDISSNYKKIITFENSPHVICNGKEKEECAQKCITFLEKRTPHYV